jgi:flagellar basal-body rod modification protein FlgD
MSDNGTPVADGSYTMSVSALRGDQKVDAQTLAFGTVQGVSQGSQGIQLNVGGVGSASLADVKQIF